MQHQNLFATSRTALRAAAPHRAPHIMSFIPPLNFGMVEEDLYRSAQPTELNFPFLEKLHLRSCIYLASDELPRGQPQNAGMDSPRPGAEPSETQLSETSESSRGSGRMCQCLCSAAESGDEEHAASQEALARSDSNLTPRWLHKKRDMVQVRVRLRV